MDIVILGSGGVGTAAGLKMATDGYTGIVIASNDTEGLARIEEEYGLGTMELDVRDEASLVETLKDFDLAIGALPGKFGFRTVAATIHAGLDMVDVSFMPEDYMTLHSKAASAGVKVIPDCGLAPGISNILVGHAYTQMSRCRSIKMLVGGLPEEPKGVLKYETTWSVEDLIEEYTRPARVMRGGRMKSISPMDDVRAEGPVCGIDGLESFATDGLRSLLYTLDRVDDMEERTLRYRGHLDLMGGLIELGFLSSEPVTVKDKSLVPRDFSTHILEKGLARLKGRDIALMDIEMKGVDREGSPLRYGYEMLDHFDTALGLSAMQRCTGFTCAVVAELLAEDKIGGGGIIPPEMLGMNQQTYPLIMKRLEEEDIVVRETVDRD